MEPTQVRDRVLAEHTRLRELLDELVAQIERFESGSPEVGAELRSMGMAFFEVFAAHIGLEDSVLVPVLRELEDGERRAERLAREHLEQRELREYLMGRLRNHDRPSTLIARELRSFVEYVRQDMQHEEETILREDLLRD